MKFNEYQVQAVAFVHPNHKVLDNAVMGLCGEVGEVADHLKKHRYMGQPLDRRHLLKELGDVLWYLALAAETLGLDLDFVAAANLVKLRARYPDGFTTEAGLARADELAEAS